jgi:hypothetical protein
MREEEAFIAFVAILCGSGLAWAVIRHCSWACRTWFETALKRDMVARGYAPQEIIAVVKADRKCGWRSGYSDVPPAKPIRQPAYSP